MADKTQTTLETGWLVEGKHLDSSAHWYTLGEEYEDGFEWTKEAHRALRFARKIDAENFINDIGWTDVVATEHMWSDIPRPSMREITLESNKKARKAFELRHGGMLLKEIGTHFGVGIEGARRWVNKGRRLFERERKHLTLKN